MLYFNPYHLLHLEPDSPEAVNASLLRQAKRRLLAEFELGEGVAIEVRGIELDKSQALRLLEELEDDSLKRHHWRVLKDKALFLLLSEPAKGILDAIPEWDALPDQGYRNFLSPFLAESLSRKFSEAIRTKSYHLLEAIVAKTPILLARDMDKVFGAAQRKANQGIEQLAQWVKNPDPIRSRQKELWELIDRNFLLGLNVLPNRFQNLRNRYAKTLADLAVTIRNVLNQRFLASRVIINADLLVVDVHVKKKVEHVLHQLVRYRPQHRDLKPRPPRQPRVKTRFRWLRFLFRGVVIAISLAVLLFMIGLYMENTTYRPPPKTQPSTSVSLKYAKRIRLFNQLNEYAFEQQAIGIESNVPLPAGGMHGSQPYAFVFGAQPVSDLGGRPYVFRNESSKDAVIFMLPDYPEEECLHFYVAADSQQLFRSTAEGEMTLQAFAGEDWENGVLPYFTMDGNVNLGAFKRATRPLSVDKTELDSSIYLETNVLERRWLEDNVVATQMGMHVDSPVVFILEDGSLFKKEDN